MNNKDIPIAPRNSDDLKVISQEPGKRPANFLLYNGVAFLYLYHLEFVELLEV